MKADPNDLPWQKINFDIRLVSLGESLAQRDQPLRLLKSARASRKWTGIQHFIQTQQNTYKSN